MGARVEEEAAAWSAHQSIREAAHMEGLLRRARAWAVTSYARSQPAWKTHTHARTLPQAGQDRIISLNITEAFTRYACTQNVRSGAKTCSAALQGKLAMPAAALLTRPPLGPSTASETMRNGQPTDTPYMELQPETADTPCHCMHT